MPTTPTQALPYPAPTELVTNGADAIQDLAEAVAARLDAIATSQPIPAAFHVSGAVALGVKQPRFLVPVPVKLRAMRARLDSGSGLAYRVLVNGSPVTGAAATAVGTTVVATDPVDVDLNVGDAIQLEVTTAGTSPVGLSVTVDLATR